MSVKGVMRIVPPRITEDGDVVRISSDLVFAQGAETLWFECDKAFAHGLTPETSDGFVVAGLLVAMARGVDLHVEGPMSSRLYYNISRFYIEILIGLIPGLKRIRVVPAMLHQTNWGGTGAITGFSGGVDSFSTVMDHLAGSTPPEYALNHFLFNNVGSHGQSDRDAVVFRQRFDRLSRIACEKFGLPMIAVDSNLDAVLGLNFKHTASTRNIAVALLFQKLCGKFLFSSAVHFRDVGVVPPHDMGDADSLCVPLLSTEGMECVSAGSQYTRVLKTERISCEPVTFDTLDVCVSPPAGGALNCSKCWKCLRTELTLEVVGALPSYGQVFDLKTYGKYRWGHICEVLQSRNELLVELRVAMKERGFKVPVSARLASAVLPRSVFKRMRHVRARPKPWQRTCWRSLSRAAGGLQRGWLVLTGGAAAKVQRNAGS